MSNWTDTEPSTGKTYKELWDNGYDAGYQMAKSLGRPVITEDFPEDFQHRGNVYWNGYAEGVMAGGIYRGNK